jgi:hypothetical protein
MNNLAEQTAAGVSAIILLVDYLAGVSFGMIGCMVFGSVLENHLMSLMEPQAPGPITAGVRTLMRPFVLDDDGYLRSLPAGRRATARGRRTKRSNRPAGSAGREVSSK